MPDFLLEIGAEEIPARMIDSAVQELQKRVYDALKNHGLEPSSRNIGHNATPRRLCVIATELPDKQPDMEERLTGPAIKVAFKDGEPTAAALSFANKVGIAIPALDRITTPKGEYLSARILRKGRNAADVLMEILPKEIAALSWAKNMYWRESKPERFVRPVRWIVCLIGETVVPIEFAGVVASNKSRGHRVLGPDQIVLETPTCYNQTLEGAHVIASADKRKDLIAKLLSAAISDIPGSCWREDKDLLDTVVYLTEYPAVVLGNFDPAFLLLPEEILVTVMRDHQKYFAVEGAGGKLAPHFLAVLNTDGDRDGIIRHGNERVLRARFNDAQFFWRTDQKIPLNERVEMLRSVVFHKDLGTYHDKTERLRRSATNVAASLKGSHLELNSDVVHEAARLSKTDLTTELVKEFTELQGIVGGLYVQAQGLHGCDETFVESVSAAIYDHYKPESMTDKIPDSVAGCVVSLTDKADTIAGMFLLNQHPSGSKDPYALRRQGNAIIRILAERNLPIPLTEILTKAVDAYTQDAKLGGTLVTSGPSKYAQLWCQSFFRERLDFYLKERENISYDVSNAVLASDPDQVSFDDVPDTISRARALMKVRDYPDFQSIAFSFKRIKNILRQAAERNVPIAPEFQFLPKAADEEKNLATYAMSVHARLRRSSENDYVNSLLQIATIRERLDKFFDKVMVMVDDTELRANRLALLRMIQRNFSTIADFSEIVTEKAASS